MSLRRAAAPGKPTYAQLLAYTGPVGMPTGIPTPKTFAPKKADVMETLEYEFGPPEDDPLVTPEERQAWESWRELKGSDTADEEDAHELYQKLRRKRVGLE